MQHDATMLRRKLLKGHVQRHARVCAEGVEHSREQPHVGVRPEAHGPLSEASASGRATGPPCSRRAASPSPSHDGHQPKRTVEREIVRRELLEAAAAFFAGEMLAVNFGLPVLLGHVVVGMGHVQHALAQGQCAFDRCRQCANGRRAGSRPDRPAPRPNACGGGRSSAACRPNRSCDRPACGHSPCARISSHRVS